MTPASWRTIRIPLSGTSRAYTSHWMWNRIPTTKLHQWCVDGKIGTLNVAGSRESKAHGIQERVRDVPAALSAAEPEGGARVRAWPRLVQPSAGCSRSRSGRSAASRRTKKMPESWQWKTPSTPTSSMIPVNRPLPAIAGTLRSPRHRTGRCGRRNRADAQSRSPFHRGCSCRSSHYSKLPDGVVPAAAEEVPLLGDDVVVILRWRRCHRNLVRCSVDGDEAPPDILDG